MRFVAGFDDPPERQIWAMTMSEVADQLQILEHIELNKPGEFTDGDRRLREELEEREKQLVRDRSLDPKLEDLEQKLADRQAQEAAAPFPPSSSVSSPCPASRDAP